MPPPSGGILFCNFQAMPRRENFEICLYLLRSSVVSLRRSNNINVSRWHISSDGRVVRPASREELCANTASFGRIIQTHTRRALSLLKSKKASGARPVQAAPRRQFFCFCVFTGRPSEWPVRPSGRADGSRSLQRSHRRGARRSPPRSPRPCVGVACAAVQRGQPLLFQLYAHFFGGVVAVHSSRILGRCNGCSRRSDCACPVHAFHALLQIIRNPG